MRMIWQAIRAVTVEAMGVGAVLFMLFSAAGWTMESSGGQPRQEIGRVWHWLQATTEEVTTTIQPDLTADQRQRYAAERLDYYGQMYGDAVGTYVSEAARPLDHQLVPADQKPVLPTNQLLGTL